MRILMLAQFYPPVIGGEEHAVRTMSSALVARGHEVVVGAIAPDGHPSISHEDGVEIHLLRSSTSRIGALYSDRRRHVPPGPDPELVAGLHRLARRVHPDVVHAHNWIVHSYLPVKRLSRAPLVLSLHDYSHICANKRLMRGGQTCEGPALGKCARCSVNYYGGMKGAVISTSLMVSRQVAGGEIDGFLPVSAAVATQMRLADRGLPFTVIPNFMADGLATRRAMPRHVRLPDRRYVLYVGDLSRDKGFDVLLESFRGLSDTAMLVAVGRTIDVDAKKSPGVQLLGLLDNDTVLEAFARCAVAVVPSVWPEPSGLVALEAMAMARPVVASRTGGLEEIVAHERTGLLVPPGDGAALRAAFMRLFDDPATAERLGLAGRDRVAAEFTASAVMPRLEAAYDIAISGRSR